MAKALAIRLREVMGAVVHMDQTCGVQGRSCHMNLALIRDTISWVEQRSLPLAILSVDQEKAFDRISHKFLFRVMERMGFGTRFRGWVRLLYRGSFSRVGVNVFFSRPVLQLGGVRQGCPLSPLLYVMCIEPLAAYIRQDPGIC